MKKRILSLILVAIPMVCFIGCSSPFAKDQTDIEKIKEQVRAEMEEENKKGQEQEEKIREQVKKELEEQKAESSDKNVNVNVTNDSKPDSVVVVKETIPTSVYYNNSYIFPQSSSSYLTKSQVRSLSNYQLGIARNEIYARHGYIFKLATFKNYFESQSWYVPRYSNQNSITLNEIENYNVGLIKAEEDRRGIQW